MCIYELAEISTKPLVYIYYQYKPNINESITNVRKTGNKKYLKNYGDFIKIEIIFYYYTIFWYFSFSYPPSYQNAYDEIKITS